MPITCVRLGDPCLHKQVVITFLLWFRITVCVAASFLLFFDHTGTCCFQQGAHRGHKGLHQASESEHEGQLVAGGVHEKTISDDVLNVVGQKAVGLRLLVDVRSPPTTVAKAAPHPP